MSTTARLGLTLTTLPETQPHNSHIAQTSYARAGTLRFPHKIATNDACGEIATSREKPLKTKGLAMNLNTSRRSLCHKCGNRLFGSPPHHKKSQ
jgi:hypothetical protein